MKYPDESDFDVTRNEGGIHVLFKPTHSHYEFMFLADTEDIARLGPLSPSLTVRHGKTDDTEDYVADEVLVVAWRLAERAATP